MTSRFLTELSMRAPLLTDTIDHRNFKLCRCKLEALSQMLPPETVIVLVGPSNCGKSLLLAYFVSCLTRVFSGGDPAFTPIIGVTAITSREGRTTPKFVLHELLEDVGHPFYQPIPLRCERAPYQPSIRLDETYSLRALKSALHAAGVRVVICDDAHYLVRSKDEDFRASLLESFKGLITPRTTLVLAGGYELAKVALALRAHFSTRVIVVHLPRYTDSTEDVAEWLSIMGNLSKSPKLHLEQPDILIQMADNFRRDSHGTIGVIERRLVDSQTDAMALGELLSIRLLNANRPMTDQWDLIGTDIEMGEKLLGTRVGAYELPTPPVPPPTQPGEPPKKPKKTKKPKKSYKRRSFERVPQRTQPGVEL